MPTDFSEPVSTDISEPMSLVFLTRVDLPSLDQACDLNLSPACFLSLSFVLPSRWSHKLYKFDPFTHRRRIKTEEKAKVVASVRGKFFLNSLPR